MCNSMLRRAALGLTTMLYSAESGNGRRAALVVTNLPDVGLSRIIMPPVKPIISTLAAFDSNAIARAADKYGAWVVDLWTVSRLDARHRVQLLSRDGIHPNDEGYAVMAAAAYPMIDRAMR